MNLFGSAGSGVRIKYEALTSAGAMRLHLFGCRTVGVNRMLHHCYSLGAAHVFAWRLHMPK